MALPRPGPRAATTPGGLFALAALLLIIGLFVLNNLAPYLGLNQVGPMTMYSGLADDGGGHLFIPRLPLTDRYAYVAVVQVEAARERRTPSLALFRQLATRLGDQWPLVNLNVVRYHASLVCASAPNVRLELRLQTQDGRRLDVPNACAEPSMVSYDVVSSYRTCMNRSCQRALRRWQDVAGVFAVE